MSEGQMWELAVLRRQELWHPESPRRARRGGATLLALVVLASASAACGIAGDGISVGSCENLVTTVRTNEPSYVPGQTVIISVTQANEGPTCTGPPQPCGPAAAFASGYNSAGEDVWDDGASKTVPGNATCPPEPAPGQTWLAGYSNTQELDWSQDKCTWGSALVGRANPDCPGTQVPAGTYRIVGGYGTSAQATATSTISSETPLPMARQRSPGDARTIASDLKQGQ